MIWFWYDTVYYDIMIWYIIDNDIWHNMPVLDLWHREYVNRDVYEIRYMIYDMMWYDIWHDMFPERVNDVYDTDRVRYEIWQAASIIYSFVTGLGYSVSPTLCTLLALCCDLVLVCFTHIHQDYFTGTGAIIRLPQCQWSNPDGYGLMYHINSQKPIRKSPDYLHGIWEYKVIDIEIFFVPYVTTTKLCVYFMGYTVSHKQTTN